MVQDQYGTLTYAASAKPRTQRTARRSQRVLIKCGDQRNVLAQVFWIRDLSRRALEVEKPVVPLARRSTQRTTKRNERMIVPPRSVWINPRAAAATRSHAGARSILSRSVPPVISLCPVGLRRLVTHEGAVIYAPVEHSLHSRGNFFSSIRSINDRSIRGGTHCSQFLQCRIPDPGKTRQISLQ